MMKQVEERLHEQIENDFRRIVFLMAIFKTNVYDVIAHSNTDNGILKTYREREAACLKKDMERCMKFMADVYHRTLRYKVPAFYDEDGNKYDDATLKKYIEILCPNLQSDKENPFGRFDYNLARSVWCEDCYGDCDRCDFGKSDPDEEFVDGEKFPNESDYAPREGDLPY